MYVTSTLRKPIDPVELKTYAQWFGLKIRMDRPLPQDEVGFVIEGTGIRLESPGQKGQVWHPGLAYRRIKHSVDALRKVLALKTGDQLLDCTLGMGHDALAALDAGAVVTALEVQAPMILYTMTGLSRFAPTLTKRLHVRCCDYRSFLESAKADSFDHVYLDPMFPRAKTEKANVTWALLRTFTQPEKRLDKDTIRNAVRVARRSVVFKLAPLEVVPTFEGLPKPEIVGSKRQKYARWTI
ncbi:MAG: class I SAM-dependent methyltransferase [Myxococcota bacterium]|nr:class I SAM-dependent methyltransferase [Myxococcota bacterium]